MVAMVSVHSVLEFIDAQRVMHAQVGKDHALLHHYRRGLNDDEGGKIIEHKVINRRMHRFADRIITETSRRHRLVSIL